MTNEERIILESKFRKALKSLKNNVREAIKLHFPNITNLQSWIMQENALEIITRLQGFSHKNAPSALDFLRNFIIDNHISLECCEEKYTTIITKTMPFSDENRNELLKIKFEQYKQTNTDVKIKNILLDFSSITALLDDNAGQHLSAQKQELLKGIQSTINNYIDIIRKLTDDEVKNELKLYFLRTNTITIPKTIKEEESIQTLLIRVINEIVEILALKGEDRLSTCLKWYYLEGISMPSIGEELNLTAERVRQLIIDKFLKELLEGKIVNDICFSQEFLTWLSQTKDRLIYTHTSEPQDVSLNHFLEYVLNLSIFTCNEIGVSYYILKDNNRNAERNYFYLKNVMCEMVAPEGADEIKRRVKSEIDKEQKKNIKFLDELIEAFLSTEEWIEYDKLTNKYRIKKEYISSFTPQVVRIIYEHKDTWLDKSDLVDEYNRIYNCNKTKDKFVMTRCNEYDGINLFANKWNYNPEFKVEYTNSKELFAKLIEELNYEFYWDSIIEKLKELQVYGALTENSIRTNITEWCTSDIDDSNHFCHKDHTDLHTEYRWRKAPKQGVTNKILNYMYSILKDLSSCEMTYNKLLQHVKTECSDWGYPKDRVKSIIDNYTFYKDGNNENEYEYPFVRDNKYIWLDSKIADDINWNCYGKRGKYSVEKDDVLTFTQDLLAHTKGLSLSLNDIIKQAQQSPLTSNIDADIIRRLFSPKSDLPSVFTVTKHDDGYLWVNINSENYFDEDDEIGTDAINYDVKQPIESSANDSDVSITFTEVERKSAADLDADIDWDELSNKLQFELRYYERFYQGISNQHSVTKFINYIQNSQDYSIKEFVSNSINTYFLRASNSRSRNACAYYLTNSFEVLLRSIAIQNHPHLELTKMAGMIDVCHNAFPEYYRTIGQRDNYGFNRIFSTLHSKRNKMVHNGFAEMPSIVVAQTIIDFVALYVYTINRYCTTY